MSEFWASSGLDLLVETRRSQRRASLEHSLRGAIQAHRLLPGSRLPSSRSLADDLGWSRGTVSAAYDQLVAEGYLLSRQGAGTTVADVASSEVVSLASERPRTSRLDLRPGTPDVGAFPVAAWLRAARSALTAAPTDVFGYARIRGQPALTEALVAYLGRTRGVRAGPEQLVVTTGVTHGLSLLSTVLREAGPAALGLEDPGFFFHRDVVRRAGCCVLPLPVDEHGARLDDVAASAAGVLVTPAHQYPTGVTMSPQRRRQVTAWARETGGLVIEDDYDGEFRYDRRQVGALQGTAPDQVAYLGSTSKTLAPGLRLGWAVVPHRLVDRVTAVKRETTLGSDVTTQLTFAHLLTQHGYDRHVRAMRHRYRRRLHLLHAAIREASRDGLHVEVGGISAGGQAPLLLPPGPTEQAVVDLAAERGLALQGLASHRHGPLKAPPGLLVGFSHPSDRAYPEAIATLVEVLHDAYAGCS